MQWKRGNDSEGWGLVALLHVLLSSCRFSVLSNAQRHGACRRQTPPHRSRGGERDPWRGVGIRQSMAPAKRCTFGFGFPLSHSSPSAPRVG
ncbi:hypothetical protein QBC34DRAFT_164820 [Podospora aff. communis PSN243]|uniref:Secreted protein n=1 Tax=Podospora aff. communis PSN243 TaxID=3040156 RepID=A0AAV9GDW8_9PEZI|nr:hypothetical protein QBC34DRAFT_164820 [Podospora aff. communis PSN243]